MTYFARCIIASLQKQTGPPNRQDHLKSMRLDFTQNGRANWKISRFLSGPVRYCCSASAIWQVNNN